jgi:hypothetical protein
VLLLTVVLSVLLGPEVRSEPYIPLSDGCANAALAQLGETTFVATSAIAGGEPGISAALVNSQLTAVRSAFFPMQAAPACVAAAVNGNNILVVWTAADGIVRAMSLKADLSVVQGPSRVITALARTPIGAAWQRGARTYLIAAGTVYVEIEELDIRRYRIGTIGDWLVRYVVSGPRERSLIYDAVATSETSSALSARGFVPSQTACNFARPGCGTTAEMFSVAVARPHPVTPMEIESSTRQVGPTTVALVGERALFAWIRSPTTAEPRFRLMALWTDNTRATFQVRLDYSYMTNPISASDGEHVLLIWEEGFSTKRIVGAVMTESDPSEPFVIAESSALPRKASVVSIAPGRFLVAYQLTEDMNTSRLGGRVVHVDPPGRRRAGRR